MKEPTLRAQHLDLRTQTRAGDWRWRLRDVSVNCVRGERIGIIGANGAGKSSLARTVCGLERPSHGRVQVTPLGSRVMLVMQRPEEHFLRASVHAELEGFARHQLERIHVAALLEAVGLSARLADTAPRALSTGQQRAVAIACALATGPAFLILDEPMAGLDATGRHETLKTLHHISERSQVATLLISHHPDDLLGWAQRLWILAEGRLIYDGPWATAPVAALTRSLAEEAHSLYLTLRTLDEGGAQFPPDVYAISRPDELARLLQVVAHA